MTGFALFGVIIAIWVVMQIAFLSLSFGRPKLPWNWRVLLAPFIDPYLRWLSNYYDTLIQEIENSK